MKTFASLAATGFILASAAAYAAEGDKGLESSPANQTAMQTSQTMSTELKDGSKVEIAPDGMVSVFTKDGTKTPAPDGTWTLKDGTSITTKDGKKV